MNRWKEYFDYLLNVGSNFVLNESVDGIVNVTQMGEIRMDEIQAAVTKLS